MLRRVGGTRHFKSPKHKAPLDPGKTLYIYTEVSLYLGQDKEQQ
jgi:hypothetical protein